MVHICPVPDRFEDRIGETEEKDVLGGFLAKVVIDAVDLVFIENCLNFPVQLFCRQEIVAERFFNDDSPPQISIFRLFHATEVVCNRTEERGCGGQMKEPVCGSFFQGLKKNLKMCMVLREGRVTFDI